MKHYKVVAAVVCHDGKYLCMQKGKTKFDYTSYKWEFPGGKVESGEDLLTALDRELWEEIGIRVQDCAPFMELHPDYPDKQVLLDIWKVTRFHGEPFGKEGQECRWVPLASLHEYHFPDANGPIVARLQASLA